MKNTDKTKELKELRKVLKQAITSIDSMLVPPENRRPVGRPLAKPQFHGFDLDDRPMFFDQYDQPWSC